MVKRRVPLLVDQVNLCRRTFLDEYHANCEETHAVADFSEMRTKTTAHWHHRKQRVANMNVYLSLPFRTMCTPLHGSVWSPTRDRRGAEELSTVYLRGRLLPGGTFVEGILPSRLGLQSTKTGGSTVFFGEEMVKSAGPIFKRHCNRNPLQLSRLMNDVITVTVPITPNRTMNSQSIAPLSAM